ncbi:MAG TPA: adenylate/guanylate cyclase domain-containing protein, partial [Bacteroidales bacterium]|nr:adenylate/guanylate cyclase domain-containing protein [Bacteroidales bacterium]
MVISGNEDLVRRIAKLARQNQDLEDKIRKLLRQNEELSGDYEALKKKYDKLSSGGIKAIGGGGEKGKSLKFDMATVLFSSIYGFSSLNEKMDSSAVMDELDEILFEFDTIVSRYKIEKIKTLGDTYMCAGGIPVKNITNPVDVVMAAIEMRDYLRRYEDEKRGHSHRLWELQTGIHTGPVTATVSGKKKISYDIKGDTVNTTSRIESVSGRGKIMISVMTYELVKEFFDCEY